MLTMLIIAACLAAGIIVHCRSQGACAMRRKAGTGGINERVEVRSKIGHSGS